MTANTKTKKRFEMPHSLAIIVGVILFACFLTYIIPAGTYNQITNGAGKSVVDPNSFHYIESSPVNPLKFLTYIYKGLNSAGGIIFVLFCCSGGMGLVQSTGVLQGAANSLSKKIRGKEWLVISMITLLFTLLSSVTVSTLLIPLTPIGIMLAQALGMDMITGVGMVLLGTTIGSSTGALVAASTGIAQTIAGLPMYSGLGYRLFCNIPFWLVGNFYLVHYAAKVRKDPTKSLVYGMKLNANADTSNLVEFTKDHIPVAIVTVLGFAWQIAGSIRGVSDMQFTSNTFLYMGLAVAIVARMKLNEICEKFLKSVSGLASVGMLIGFAYSISLILKDGMILDTIVHALSTTLGQIPVLLQAPVMFLLHCLINLLITSGSGQATASMPIFLPAADMIGMSRQLAVLCFNFGDGFCNAILPHAAVTLAMVSMGDIPFAKWFKFVWKLFAAWVVVGCIMLMIATVIGY